MGITAGCYSLNVVCDTKHNSGASMSEYNLAGERTYIGRTEADSIRAAKAAGWLFVRSKSEIRGYKTFCPACVKDGRAKKRR